MKIDDNMIEIKDILNLIDNKLKDDIEETKRFREFIEKEKWATDQIKDWLDECIKKSKGAQDPYHKAFQDLIISLGKRLGFEIEYGKYMGKRGEENYDGAWKKETGETMILEVKSTTWPIGSISQLGRYIEELTKKGETENIFGMYVIGEGDRQPLTEQILGSKYKDKMRIIQKDDLINLIKLKEELEPVIGESQAIKKAQSILIPIESIDIGNIINLITEIAATKSTAEVEKVEGEETKKSEEVENPWTRTELLSYLEDATPYQRSLLGALCQVEEGFAPMKNVLYFMNEIAKKRSSEEIDKKITGRDIAGARAGLKMRRSSINKEDIINSHWEDSVKDYVYVIKPQYKQIVVEWIKKENLWIIDEMEKK